MSTCLATFSQLPAGLTYLAVMPVEFLTDDEEAAYGRYAGTPSQGELDRMFYLDDADRKLVARRRGDHTRLGLRRVGHIPGLSGPPGVNQSLGNLGGEANG